LKTTTMNDAPLASTNGPPPRTRPKNRAWIWYFVLLAVMSVATTTTLIVYNAGQQLTPEKFQAAEALWKQRGPADYDLEYTTRLLTGEVSTFRVRVRDKAVIDATMNDQPLEPRLYAARSMNGIFSDIKRFLDIDQTPGSPRAFARATFDPEDGHLQSYRRNVSATHEGVDIRVTRFEPVRK
jgi:hypothetical protein